MSRPLIIAIDGPAGAGKSTVSRRIADRLGLILVDTGAIYRCVALAVRRKGVSVDDPEALRALLSNLAITFTFLGGENRVHLDGEDVSAEIRTPENSLLASQVSSRPVVRAGLLDLQRKLALQAGKGAVLEGRDIGTVVFPDADVKVFLFADPSERARRRRDELARQGVQKPLEEVLAEQNLRDKDDSERALAPLKPAPDALQLDSSSMNLDDVVNQIEAYVAAHPRK